MIHLIPVIALTLPFVFVIVIEWMKSQERRKRYDLQAELYAKALEKGQPIPMDVFVNPKKKIKPLNIGIICIAIGIGLASFFGLMSISFAELGASVSITFRSVASMGIIPFLVGVAFLIIHFIEKKKTNEDAK